MCLNILITHFTILNKIPTVLLNKILTKKMSPTIRQWFLAAFDVCIQKSFDPKSGEGIFLRKPILNFLLLHNKFRTFLHWTQFCIQICLKHIRKCFKKLANIVTIILSTGTTLQAMQNWRYEGNSESGFQKYGFKMRYLWVSPSTSKLEFSGKILQNLTINDLIDTQFTQEKCEIQKK